jgi:hypothetical protein
MRNEIRSQRLLQFMQMAQNPAMQPFVKYDYILREIAASMDLDEDKILNDPREAAIQAKMMAEIAAMMPQPPAGAEQPQNGAPSVQDPTGSGVVVTLDRAMPLNRAQKASQVPVVVTMAVIHR